MILMNSQLPEAFAGACQDDDRDGYYHVSAPAYCGEGVPRDCDDNNADVYPGNGCDSKQDVEFMLEHVQDLVATGNLDLDPDEITDLYDRLQRAIDRLERNNTNAAEGALNSFINKMTSYVNNGSIPEKYAQPLIDDAQRIINNL